MEGYPRTSKSSLSSLVGAASLTIVERNEYDKQSERVLVREVESLGSSSQSHSSVCTPVG